MGVYSFWKPKVCRSIEKISECKAEFKRWRQERLAGVKWAYRTEPVAYEDGRGYVARSTRVVVSLISAVCVLL